MQLSVIGLNFRSAPVEIREKLSVALEQIPTLIQDLRRGHGWHEVVVLSTCNRFEIYSVAEGYAPPALCVLNAVLERAGHPPLHDALADVVYHHAGADCVRHLFRVASSLDSLVVGETEIVGQVKRAYQAAHTAGGTGKMLNPLFQNALSISKRARNESGIGRCATSVGSIALELATKIFGESLRNQSLLVLGAGKMSETVLRHLTERNGGSIVVVNRTFERARELAGKFGARALPIEALSDALREADIVISSTSSPDCVISKTSLEPIMARRKGRPLLCIDLAVPRDVDPRVVELEGVFLSNIDELGELARENLEKRRAEASACEALIVEAAEKVSQRLLGSNVKSAPRRLPVFGESAPASFSVPLRHALWDGLRLASSV